MKLKHFNPETCQPPKAAKELHLVLRRSGAICFTVPILEALKLKKGVKVELSKDEDTGDWYLSKTKTGFELRSLGQQLGFASIQLVNFIWPNRKKEDKSLRIIVSETAMNYDGTDYYLISFSKK